MLREALRRDYERNGRSTNALRVMTLYRLGHAVHESDLPTASKKILLVVLTRLQKWLVYFPFGIEMPFRAEIGPGLQMPHLNGIVLSSSVRMGADCTLYHQTTIGVNEHARIGQGAAEIGDRVYIGAGAKLIGPIRVGDDAVIGANAVITRDIGSFQTAGRSNISD